MSFFSGAAVKYNLKDNKIVYSFAGMSFEVPYVISDDCDTLTLDHYNSTKSVYNRKK